MSPNKKKPKLSPNVKGTKREGETPESPRKRPKLTVEEEMQAKKKKNFITACEQVSCKDYYAYRDRLLLLYLPSCVKSSCNHIKNTVSLQQMPSYADESFRTEMKNNMWCEALEVCHMCITPTQYLSADVLKDVVEIMLNAHEDSYSEYSVDYIVDMCQQVLQQNFSTHPPCTDKALRNCYKNFLTSPMNLKDNTFSDRSNYEYRKGIVSYCFNRLEYELSADSKDGPLLDKDANIPEDMKFCVQGMHWQKEKMEIFELLYREDRIKRLFTVLETIIELLQVDLAIWHARYTRNQGRHIMRSHKPLMAYVLWSDNPLYTGSVTNICKQILRIFTQMIHLQYPDSTVKTISYWLNTMIQTFYICETNSNMDYPNTSKYCSAFADNFYRIISDMPQDSIPKIIERIKPLYMTRLVGLLHVNKILSTDETCIIKTMINFLNQKQWNSYRLDNNESEDIKIANRLFLSPKKVKKKINYLIKKCALSAPSETRENHYRKIQPKVERNSDKYSLNHVVHILFVTLKAHLDAYDIQSVQEKWGILNQQEGETVSDNVPSPYTNYSVSEALIKKYRNILQSIQVLVVLFNDLKKQNELPEAMNIFRNIGLIDV